MPKIIVVQPSVPSYRYGYFTRVAERIGKSFSVYASPGNLDVLSERDSIPAWEHPLPAIRHIGPYVAWQSGALSIVIEKGDLVVISGAPRCLSNIALLIKARMCGATTIWWGHYWSSTSRKWSATIRFTLMKLSDAFLFYTDQEKSEYLAKIKNCRQIPVFALNNGIETDEISSLRAPYSARCRKRDLVYIGRVIQKSNLDLLINALSQPSCAGVTLDIIGDGDDKARLQARCLELKLDQRVTWHEGSVDEVKIAAVFNRCKLFVYPGAVGLSLIHALAYGLPVIVHGDRWKHGPEFAALETGSNGLTFANGDPATLSEVIADTLGKPADLTRMSAAAIATIDEFFNATDMADRFCDAIAKLLDTDMPGASAQQAITSTSND